MMERNSARSALPVLLVLLLLAPIASATDLARAYWDADKAQAKWDTRTLVVSEFSTYVSGQLDEGISRQQKIIDDPSSTQAQREQAHRWITGFQKMKVWANSPKDAADYLNLLKKGRDDLKKVHAAWRWGEGTNWDHQSVSPLEMDVKKWSKLTRGADLALKAYHLSEDLSKIEGYEYDETIQSSVKWMKVISALGSEFIGETPGLSNSAVGAILKGYFDLFGEAVNTVNALNDAMDRFDQGMLGTGAHRMGSNKQMAWQQQGFSGTIVRVPGFRDLFEDIADSNALYLWDPEAFREVTVGGDAVKRKGKWWDLRNEVPGAGLEVIRSRYLTFYRTGNRNPSAQDILSGFRKMVWLTPSIENPGVVPGGVLKVTPRMLRVHDRRDVEGLWLLLRDPETGESRQVRSGTPVEWTASREPGRHRLTLDLEPETATVWTSSGKGEAWYWVGGPTRTRISGTPRQLVTDGSAPVDLLVTVKSDDDRLVDEGMIHVRAEPGAGGFTPRSMFSAAQHAEDGAVRLQWEPAGIVPRGLLHLVAEYEGTRKISDGEYLTPSKDQVEIAVFEPVTPELRIEAKGGVAGWELTAELLDQEGRRIREGALKWTSSDGTLSSGTQRGDSLELRNEKDATVRWTPKQGAGEVVVSFPGFRSEKTFYWYKETQNRKVLTAAPPQAPTKKEESPPPATPGKVTRNDGEDPQEEDESIASAVPPPRVNWDLKFGVSSSSRVTVAEGPGEDAPPREELDAVSFDQARRDNTGLPPAPTASGIEMGSDSRPPATNPKRPEVAFASGDFMDFYGFRFCNKSRPSGSGMCPEGREVEFLSGQMRFGKRCYQGEKVVFEVSMHQNDRYGPTTIFTDLEGKAMTCTVYYEDDKPRVGRVTVDDVIVAESVALQGDNVRYMELDKAGLKHLGTYKMASLMEPVELCRMMKDRGGLADFKRLGPPVVNGVGLIQIWSSGSGPLTYEASFQEGLPEWDRIYHADGSWALETTYDRDGKLHGWQRQSWPGGIPARETPYIHGVKQGVDRKWSAEGRLAAELEWDEDKELWNRSYCEDNPDYARNHTACSAKEYEPPGQIARESKWFPNGTASSYMAYQN